SVLVSSSPHLRMEIAMTSLAVEVRGLTKTYSGGVQAVREIDFDVRSGEVFGLLGPNGAGKSTTVGMLTGTVAPTAASPRLAGREVASEPLEARRVSAVVFQEAVVDRPLTGRRNLEIHARLWGLDAGATARRLREVVDAFGLREVIDRPVSSYSGGQRRRLELSRALLSEPQVLFLDEPTVGLDPLIRYELLDLIDGLRRRGEMTVVLTTHYLDEAERLCDRVAIMHAGRIVALDAPQALLRALGTEVLEVRVDGDPTATLTRLRAHGMATDDVFSLGGTLPTALPGPSAEPPVLTTNHTGLNPPDPPPPRPPLDDVSPPLTGGRLAAP